MSSRWLNSFSASMCGYVLFCCSGDQFTLCFFFSASGVRRLVIQGGNISVLVACQNEMHNSYFYTDLHIHKHQSGCGFYYLVVAKCENFAKENFCSLETMFPNQ